MVTLSTSSGSVEVEWDKVPSTAQIRLGDKYRKAVAQAEQAGVQELRRRELAEEKAQGIYRLEGWKVLQVVNDGLLLVNDGVTILLTNYSLADQVVDGTEIPKIKVKIEGIYRYASVQGAMPAFGRLATISRPKISRPKPSEELSLRFGIYYQTEKAAAGVGTSGLFFVRGI
jgi:hypothetical protein